MNRSYVPPKTMERLGGSPLKPFVERYVVLLAEQAYKAQTAIHHVQLFARFDRWFRPTRRRLRDLSERVLERFLIQHPLSRRSPQVFVRTVAPHVRLAGSPAIAFLARRALEQAGVESARKGAHVFRHSLATEMLRQGASLEEIAQVLRHKDPDTTAIYAKVDLEALRRLTMAWPGGER